MSGCAVKATRSAALEAAISSVRDDPHTLAHFQELVIADAKAIQFVAGLAAGIHMDALKHDTASVVTAMRILLGLGFQAGEAFSEARQLDAMLESEVKP